MSATHISEITSLAAEAHGDEQLREQFFADIHCKSRDTAVKSAWILTHLPSADNIHIATHRKRLTSLATETTDTSLRRLTLTLLERLDWTTTVDDMPEYYISLLDFCLNHMMLSDEAYGVRSLCMKIAYKISTPYAELADELRRSLSMLEPAELGTGVRHTRNKLLKELNQ
ncbi:MAG: hypothetical protein IJ524_04825 [Bacteroidales bacterium]|nr:hypothetical protein [Bacteroidales bacterium]